MDQLTTADIVALVRATGTDPIGFAHMVKTLTEDQEQAAKAIAVLAALVEAAHVAGTQGKTFEAWLDELAG